jgi:putative transposase
MSGENALRAAADSNPTLPSRKNIRLPAEHYVGPRLYFVTLCFYRRSRLGADARVAAWLASALQRIAVKQSFLIHAWCVMPDHLHFLAEGASDRCNLVTFVGDLKQHTAFHFARRRGRRLWQSKFYDHVLRSTDSFEPVAWYIWMNPVRQAMCRSPANYASLGAFTDTGADMLGRGAPSDTWVPPWSARR